jgi:hypothetical protein
MFKAIIIFQYHFGGKLTRKIQQKNANSEISGLQLIPSQFLESLNNFVYPG